MTTVLALAVAGAVALVAVAFAANVQTFKPKTTALDGAMGTTPEKAKVFVKVTTEDPSAVVPDPVTRARISFDKAIDIAPNSVAKCQAADLENKTTAQAKNACPTAIVGSGGANARTVGGANLPATVTAFNGQPNGSDPADTNGVVLLHTYVPDAGIILVLRGPLRNGSASGSACGPICNNRYDRMIDVTVPGLPGTVLTEFHVTVKKGNYIKAACSNSDGKLKYGSWWNYGSNPDIVINKAHAC